MRTRHAIIISTLLLVLAAQAIWSVRTTSGTYDESTYLGFGRYFYQQADATSIKAVVELTRNSASIRDAMVALTQTYAFTHRAEAVDTGATP